MRIVVAPMLAVLLGAAPAIAASELQALIDRTPPDSLLAPLERFERERGRTFEAGQAAFTLGQLHFARGEYRGAAESWVRAAARLDPARKAEARYWAGLAWMAVPDLDQARGQLEEVERVEGPRSGDARLALAAIATRRGRTDEARDLIERLLASHPGEAAPAALEQLAALDEAAGRSDLAARSRARLEKDYPESMEAAVAAVAPPAPPRGASVAVQIGAFADVARAGQLAESARRAGLPGVRVVTRREGGVTFHAVLLGPYPDEAAARRGAERAARSLGVGWKLLPQP